MAVYICSICGERHECDERPKECVVCGSTDFRLEGESVPQSEVRRDPGATDIDYLFVRHDMVFPPVKAEQDKKERQKVEADIRRKAQEDSETKKKNIHRSPRETLYAFIFFLCVLGEVVGWASCPFTETPIPWIFFSVISAIIWVINEKSFKKFIAGRKADAERVLTDGEEEIARYGNVQAGNYQAYCEEFERASQKLSEQYVGTEFVIRIAEWIFEPFDRKIREADREERIAEIRLDYFFSVDADRIVCSNGTYDFRGHGLRDVDDPVCQTALALAIGAAVRILVMQKYPQDPSGTPVTVCTAVSYQMDYPTETMTYIAKNGNYNASSVW